MGMEVRLLHHLHLCVITITMILFQGILAAQYPDRHWSYHNNAAPYSNSYPSHSQYYHRTENYNPPLPETQTEYGIETIQRGSAYVNPQQKNYTPVRIAPDKDQTQHYFVSVNTTTHYLPGKPYQPQNSIVSNPTSPTTYNDQTKVSHPRRHQRRHHYRSVSSSSGGDCVKCPPEKVVVAQKGLDGVLIDPPKLMSCHNRAILNGVYHIETLFGSQFKFLLPHGTHSFHGKIRSKRNLKFEQSCILRYKVIVQQCGRFYPQDENLRAKCDPGYIWGSKCHFTCRTGYLSHNEPMVCGDSLNWEGDEPECLPEPPAPSYPIIHSSKSCDFVEIPDNGKFSCQYPSNVNGENYENELVTPEGTICRVTCNRNYEIPNNLIPYSILRCENGQWNSTANGLCRLKYRYRY